MIATTFSSEAVYLLPYQPAAMGSASFAARTKGDRAQDGSEGRQALRHTLVTAVNFPLSLDGADAKQFRTALKDLENKRVLCPFWPAARPATESTTVHWASTGIWLTLEPDLSAHEVHTASSPSGSFSGNAWRVPLMLGIFASDPAPAPMGGGVEECSIDFIETGDAAYALRAKTVTYADGPSVAGRTPKVFPIVANWQRPQRHGRASVEIERTEQGYNRRPAESYHPQTPERILEIGVSSFDDAECAALLGFFHARQGNVESFWVEGQSAEVELAASTSSGSAVVSLVSVAHLADTRFLSFNLADGTSVLREVISINEGANTVTLNSSPGTIALGTCRVVALILARFEKPEIEFAFSSPVLADIKISVREVAAEYATPSGDTYGTTFGALPRVAYLYRVIEKYPGGDVTTRYTSYERQIDAAGEIFTPLRGLTHSAIPCSIDLDSTAVSLSVETPTSGPLSKLSPFRLEVPLHVEILECSPDASGASAAGAHRFIGAVRAPKRKGVWLTFQAVHLIADLNEDVPALLLQPGDNYELFSAENGLVEADWTFTANVVSVSTGGAAITIGTIARSAGVPTLTAGYFAQGRVWKGSGSSLQSRTIVNSTAASGGQVTLYLAQPFDGTVSGSLSLTPGYSGEIDELETKFGARHLHGGFAYQPVGNPSLVPIKQETKTGKK